MRKDNFKSMKTEFEEVYSLVMHTDRYKDVTFYYVGTNNLRPFEITQIIRKYEGLLLIEREKDYGMTEQVEIPIHAIRVIIADGEILLDRRYSYDGEKDMSLDF